MASSGAIYHCRTLILTVAAGNFLIWVLKKLYYCLSASHFYLQTLPVLADYIGKRIFEIIASLTNQ